MHLTPMFVPGVQAPFATSTGPGRRITASARSTTGTNSSALSSSLLAPAKWGSSATPLWDNVCRHTRWAPGTRSIIAKAHATAHPQDVVSLAALEVMISSPVPLTLPATQRRHCPRALPRVGRVPPHQSLQAQAGARPTAPFHVIHSIRTAAMVVSAPSTSCGTTTGATFLEGTAHLENCKIPRLNVALTIFMLLFNSRLACNRAATPQVFCVTSH